LPSSMSGLPALRCFIFFAIDLFILLLPSFYEAPEYAGSISLFYIIYPASSSLLMDELNSNPKNLRKSMPFSS
jgi:hypothetical protein